MSMELFEQFEQVLSHLLLVSSELLPLDLLSQLPDELLSNEFSESPERQYSDLLSKYSDDLQDSEKSSCQMPLVWQVGHHLSHELPQQVSLDELVDIFQSLELDEMGSIAHFYFKLVHV